MVSLTNRTKVKKRSSFPSALSMGRSCRNIVGGRHHGCPDGVPCNTLIKEETGKRERSRTRCQGRSEEHTSELQSLAYLVCRLLLEKKKNKQLIILVNGRAQVCI